MRNCDYFLTTDDIILKKMLGYLGIVAINPINFITLLEP